MANTTNYNERATEGEDVRRSPQRENAAPRLRPALTTEEPSATRDQSRRPAALAFAGPANASPLPAYIPLDGQQEPRVAPAAPVAARAKAPITRATFRPVLEELAKNIAQNPPTPLTHATIQKVCRIQWAERVRQLGRYDHHAPENTARLVRSVCALPSLERPSAPAKSSASTREQRATRLELPSRL